MTDRIRARLRATVILLATAACPGGSGPAAPASGAAAPSFAATAEATQLARVAKKLKSQDPKARREAFDELDQLKSAAALSVLADALKSPDASDREQAVGVLAGYRDAASVPLLVSALRDQETRVREMAATGLGDLGDRAQSTRSDLVGALADSDPEVRVTMAGSLWKVSSDARAIPVLMDGLKAADAQARLQAAKYLGEIGKPAAAAVPALKKAMDDPDPAVAGEALKAARTIVRAQN